MTLVEGRPLQLRDRSASLPPAYSDWSHIHMGRSTGCLAFLVAFGISPGDAQVPNASICVAEKYAADASWFINKEPLEINGGRYVKHGMPQVLAADRVAPSRDEGVPLLHDGVPLFEGYASDRDTLLTYVPVRPGCEFQGYESDRSERENWRQDYDGEPMGPEVTLPAHLASAFDEADLTTTDGKYKEDFVPFISEDITVLISLVSENTDTYLELWRETDSGELERVSFNDDAENMGKGSRLTAELESFTTYVVRATTSAAGGSGAFIIDIREHEPEEMSKGLRMSTGELTSADARLENGAYYDDVVVELDVGERLVVTMASEKLDSYLRIGAGLGAQFETLEENDDSGGMVLGSRVEFFATRNDNQYTVRASSLGEGLGAYTLTFETFAAP